MPVPVPMQMSRNMSTHMSTHKPMFCVHDCWHYTLAKKKWRGPSAARRCEKKSCRREASVHTHAHTHAHYTSSARTFFYLFFRTYLYISPGRSTNRVYTLGLHMSAHVPEHPVAGCRLPRLKGSQKKIGADLLQCDLVELPARCVGLTQTGVGPVRVPRHVHMCI